MIYSQKYSYVVSSHSEDNLRNIMESDARRTGLLGGCCPRQHALLAHRFGSLLESFGHSCCEGSIVLVVWGLCSWMIYFEGT